MALAAGSTPTTDPSSRTHLCLPTLALGCFADGGADDPFLAVVDGARRDLHLHHRPVLPKVLPLPDEARTLPERAFDVGFHVLAGVGHDLVQPHPAQLVGGVAEHVLRSDGR